MRKLHIVNMPFCSALFLKTAIKAAEIFEHLIILSRGPAPSGPLSFCQKNFSELKMQKAEHLFFRRCSALLYFFLWIYDAFFNFWAASGALC